MAEVLIAGASGGRERALQQAMETSPEVNRVEVVSDIYDGLTMFSGQDKPFVIIGPEAPLVDGMADELREIGYTVLGASQAMAGYEASKSKAVQLARVYDITHPDTFIAEGEADAYDFVKRNKPSAYVIKADKDAGGKGVFLPDSEEEATDIVEGLLSGRLANGAGSDVINFAERCYGPEVSPLVLVGADENDILILPLAQDHKRLKDNDKGPNTGGMGAYSPLPSSIVSDKRYSQIHEQIIKTLAGMRAEGADIRGSVLYPAYMLDEKLEGQPTLLEINVRFGDPEAQVVLRRLVEAGIDVYRLLRSTAEGSLEKPDMDMRGLGGAALTVCLAAEGYPDSRAMITGDIVYGLEKAYKDVTIQVAGAKEHDGRLVTSGGRVLYLTGIGETVDDAAQSAYAAIGVEGIYFEGMQYRNDIGWQAREATL